MIESLTKFSLLVLERFPGVAGATTLMLISMGIGFAYLEENYTRHSDLEPLIEAIGDLRQTLRRNRLTDRRDRIQADIWRIERWARQGTADNGDLAYKDDLRLELVNIHEQLALLSAASAQSP